eukprot:symbB.v1.2.038775.t1/scaffold6156.1/size20464/3
MAEYPFRPQSIAIIGGGVSGLQALRALENLPQLQKIVLFEKSNEIGGVWRSNYAGYGAQVKREQYSFVELDSKNLDLYPTGRQLKLHCEDYVHTFSLRPFLRLGVQVQKLFHDRSKRCWRLALNDETCEDFDFVVLAIGNFSEKFIPEVLGMQNFMGHILHSCDLVDAQLVRNHHVVVVGYGKSALDCFILASKEATSVTLVARSPAWILPQRFLGIPLEYLASTRWFANMVFPPYHNASWLRRIIGYVLVPFQTILWWILSPMVWLHFCLPRSMWPQFSLRWQLWHGHVVSICNAQNVKEAFARPNAHCMRGEVVGLTGTSVVVEDAITKTRKEQPADVVVFATGYRECWSKLFDEETLAALDPYGDGSLDLFKLMLPQVPQLAFVGRVLTTCDIVTSFIQAQWLAALLQGHFSWPNLSTRIQWSQRYRQWRQMFGPKSGQTFIAVPRVFSYFDELMSDLDIPKLGWSGCRRFFSPLAARHFMDVPCRQAKVVRLHSQEAPERV